MPILSALKAATAAAHARAEAALPPLDLLGEPATYRDVIRHFHAFYTLWEPAVWTSDEVASLFDADKSARMKLPLLEADLAALGVNAMSVRDVPVPCLSPQSALGALYVIEGATLGGRVILRHLASRLPVRPQMGTSFFAGYEGRTSAMWREFGDALERRALHIGGTDEIMEGAFACFSAFEHWFLASRTLYAPLPYNETAHA